MYCPECKEEFDSKFCPNCGTKLVEKEIDIDNFLFEIDLQKFEMREQEILVKVNQRLAMLKAMLEAKELELITIHRKMQLLQRQIDQLQSGEMSADALKAMNMMIEHQQRLIELEEASCPSAGSCQGLYTANTMACLTEVIGMSLPWCATSSAVSSHKRRIAFESGMQIIELVKQ